MSPQLARKTFAISRLSKFVTEADDISGFGIAKTSDSRRYQFEHKIEHVHDLGLCLADVGGVASEWVAAGKNYRKLATRLRINGATDEEIAFLLDGEIDDVGNIVSGRRVELNAMTSDQFVDFIKGKLTVTGAKKVVPDTAILTEAYVAIRREILARPVVRAVAGAPRRPRCRDPGRSRRPRARPSRNGRRRAQLQTTKTRTRRTSNERDRRPRT
jgi:hypothetical protein